MKCLISNILLTTITIGFICAHETQELAVAKFKINKCCNPGQHVATSKGHKICVAPKNKRFIGLDYSDFLLHDKELYKTNRSVKDVYDLVPGRMNDTLFNDAVYDYSTVGHLHYLTTDGELIIEIPNEFKRWHHVKTDDFCVDYFLQRGVPPDPRIWAKLEVTPPEPDDPLVTYGLFTSCVFLVLVLVVYSLLEELRTLGGLVLMAYVVSLFSAFLLLGTLQLKQYTREACLGLTYCIYFFFLSSFCWMNIMSCDIWWTFRGYAKAREIHRRGECFKFSMYCLYAYGLPAGMTIGFIILNHTNMRHIPSFITPNLIKRSCFLEGYPKLFYLYCPMLILILCNWMFFLMTAFNIWRLHRSTAVLDSAAAGTPAAHRKQTYRLVLYLKLSVIMGINWLLEVISSFWPGFKGWYVSDIYNMFVGVSIFLIFVCKKTIFRRLKKRCLGPNKWNRRCQSSKSRSSSQTTESDVSQDTPLQAPICNNPKGTVFTYDLTQHSPR